MSSRIMKRKAEYKQLRRRPAIESLESRDLMAVLGFDSALVNPDGRIVQVVFKGTIDSSIGVPDTQNAAASQIHLTTNTGQALEPLGTVVTQSGQTLTWTSSFLIDDPSQAIAINAAPTTLTASTGLLTDSFGNTTAALSQVPVVNASLVDANGFSTQTFQRGAGGLTIYVSSSHGSDSRNALQATDPRTPFQTVNAAINALMANGQDHKGAAIRLLRGDTFSGDILLRLSGQDRTHPFVMEDYWYDYGTGKSDPQTRPIVAADWSKGIYNGLRGTYPPATTPLDNYVIRRIDFEAVNRGTLQANGYGMYDIRGGTNRMVDDCVFNNFTSGMCIQGYFNPSNEFTLLRTRITDSHVVNGASGPSSQGLYIDTTTNVLISQSTFDRNGETDASFIGRNMYDHNIYLSERGNGPAIVWGNVMTSGSSHGIQMRSGGIMAYNYFAHDAIAGLIDGPGGAMTNNIVEKSEDIASNAGRGWGLSIGSAYGSALASAATGNIIVNSNSSTRLFGMELDAFQGNAVQQALIRNNTLYNNGPFFYYWYNSTGSPHASTFNNLIADTTTEAGFSTVVTGAFPGYGWLTSDKNDLQVSAATITRWQAATGGDANSVATPPAFINSSANVASYSQSMGGPTTEADFMNAERTRALGAWSPLFDMTRLYTYYSQQYRPTNLTASGSGAFDYYGAVDYRGSSTPPSPPGPPLIFNSGFATGTVGVLTFNNGAVVKGSRLRLSDGGMSESRSVFSTLPEDITKFNTAFTFQIDPNTNAADGFTFTIQQVGNFAHGDSGGALGYSGSKGTQIGKSLAIKFDLFNNAGEGSNSTGVYTNGAMPTVGGDDLTSSGINLHSGHTLTASITYDGSSLGLTISDPSTGKSFTKTYAGYNIPQIVGGNTAYVGFTAGTGGASSIQDILAWNYTGGTTGAPNGSQGGVNLAAFFNGMGITSDGSPFPTNSGLDGAGTALSGNLLGSSISWNGTAFNLGIVDAPNTVTAAGQTIPLPSGKFSSLKFLGTAIGGNQTGQTFTVTYTDGTSTTVTQSMSDWYTPQSYTGESTAATTAYRNHYTGAKDNRTFRVYGYAIALDPTKTVAGINLPNNQHVKLLAITLATSQVMGSLAGLFNSVGITSDGSQFPATSGLDGTGNALSGKLLGSSISWGGTTFNLGAADTPNTITATGQTIPLPSGKFSSLEFLGTAIRGNQTGQTFTVTYTDGTTTTATQSMSDWYTPQSYTGESTAATLAYRNQYTGTKDNRTFRVYGYAIALDPTKTVAGITLPNNQHVTLLAVTLAASQTMGSLGNAFNGVGITSDGSQFPATSGLDGTGNALSGKLLGSSISWGGTTFNLGAADAPNTVTAAGQTIPLPSGKFSSLKFLGTAIGGNQTGQTFTVAYTDGTTTTATQSMSDWYTPQSYTGESTAAALAYRNQYIGTKDNRTFRVYGYAIALDPTKTVAGITLPNNQHVKLLAVTLTA